MEWNDDDDDDDNYMYSFWIYIEILFFSGKNMCSSSFVFFKNISDIPDKTTNNNSLSLYCVFRGRYIISALDTLL